MAWWTLVWFLLSLAALAVVNRWFDRHLWRLAFLISGDDRVADFIHFGILLPGVILHELSHWLIARLVGLRAGRLELWPQPDGDALRLGSVQVQQADPLRNSLVGLAPLLTGSLLLFLIGRQVFRLEDLVQHATATDWQATWTLLTSALEVADLWLWAYLVFAVANAMLPSRADRYAWWTVILYAAILTVLYWLLSGSLPSLPRSVWENASIVLVRLAATFNLALVVDAVFGAALFLAELGLSRLHEER
jgi:hypothetical protein